MYKRLRKINQIFKNKQYQNPTSLLFPHTWQNTIDKNDKEYKTKYNQNTQIRFEILRIVKEYVTETQRFNGEFGE